MHFNLSFVHLFIKRDMVKVLQALCRSHGYNEAYNQLGEKVSGNLTKTILQMLLANFFDIYNRMIWLNLEYQRLLGALS